jgi:hypothetical protein
VWLLGSSAVVEREGDRALVEADAAVVGAGQQVARVRRVEDDVVLGLAPEAAVLVDADVAVGVALAASEGAGADADVGLAGVGGDRAVGGEQPVVGRAHPALRVDLLGRLEQAAGQERRPLGADLPAVPDDRQLGRPEAAADRVVEGLGLRPAGRSPAAEGDQGRQQGDHTEGRHDPLVHVFRPLAKGAARRRRGSVPITFGR